MIEGIKGSPLGGLARLRDCTTRRASSWDRSGGNDDRLHIQPGQEAVLADIQGAGTINHIWVTVDRQPRSELHHLRKIILRAWWDGEATPSIEVPIGDFFGIGHGKTRNFTSLPLQMSPEGGRAFNCWFPMPFGRGARLTVTNECEAAEVLFYYYVDYEQYADSAQVDGLGRFHAQWRRQNATDGWDYAAEAGGSGGRLGPREGYNRQLLFEGENTDGAGNYVLLEAAGQGHYVGCNLNIHNLRQTTAWNWYGEGDDMIFIDGEPWPPRLHGTGTEDYFNTAWCPTQEYSAPYHGITLPGGPNWSGQISLYRFHIEDPVHFQRSIKVTIEHGHANRRSDDFSSTAYWYQAEPHAPFPVLRPMRERLPLPE